ncbi:MAG: peptidyl-tRNA hydrolase [Paenibacillaceae bacterium]|nr:peptidyl-tRNA hydrolase [Paenibacillaceae bacterium]
MLWIIGLGNPGKQYEATRHNVGFMAIDRLAEKWKIPLDRNKGKYVMGEGKVGEERVYLLKPMTFMNLSGEAARSFADYYKADIDRVIVIYDDLDTPLGSIRLRYQGSSGGHNGIKSLIQHLGTQNFKRVRIGISRPEPGGQVIDYVLSPFKKAEQVALDEALNRTVEACDYLLDHSFDATMAKYNGTAGG